MKTNTVWVVANAATGEWICVADSQAVADGYIRTKGIASWTNITSVEVLTRRDVSAVAATVAVNRIENSNRLVARGRCPDCGKQGERKGHQDCQYPS
jgi:hypothetical protein